MILMLSGSGGEARELSALWKKIEMEHLCVLPNLREAAAFGSGNVVVGSFQFEEMKHFLHKEKILGVADVDRGGNAMSQIAMDACAELGIPYVKYIPLPDKKSFPTGLTSSYGEIAEGIDCLKGTALLYTTSAAAAAIAEKVNHPEKLYAPILRSTHFDVKKALRYGLPLLNVMEADDVESEDAIAAMVEKVGAELLICDGSMGTKNQIAVGKKMGIPAVLTHHTGMEYPQIAWTEEELVRLMRGWRKNKVGGTE